MDQLLHLICEMAPYLLLGFFLAGLMHAFIPGRFLGKYLSARLAHDYSALSKLFSEVSGITVERFAILHRVEYAKELLCYSQLTTSESSSAEWNLGYGISLIKM